MSSMDSYKVMLDGPAPWGFRLQGGKDFNMPLSISRLTPGGKAAQAGVGVGDWVLSIDGENTSSMTHIEAQNKIRACGDQLSLSLSRVQCLLGKPHKVQNLDKSVSLFPLLRIPSPPLPWVAGLVPTPLWSLEPSCCLAASLLSAQGGAGSIASVSPRADPCICLVPSPSAMLGYGWVVALCRGRVPGQGGRSLPKGGDFRTSLIAGGSKLKLRGTSRPSTHRLPGLGLLPLPGFDLEWGAAASSGSMVLTPGRAWLGQLQGRGLQDPDAAPPLRSQGGCLQRAAGCHWPVAVGGCPLPRHVLCNLRAVEQPVPGEVMAQHGAPLPAETFPWSRGGWDFHLTHPCSCCLSPGPRVGAGPSPPEGKTQPRGDLGRSYMEDEHALRLMSPPTGLPNDSSKKRLIEDTEDWQPRTGTTQSRSFRILAHLTGTEFMQDPDDEHVRKASQVSGLDPSAVAALKVEPDHGSAAPRPPAAPGPASRPPWAVDPSFAERYAPDKTSTVLSKHSQPAMPTPMQNRSSIVQAAQQPPEGTSKTPICYQCNKVIRGRYLVALGHYYHPEEFMCCQCRKVLDEGGFFEEKGSVFCPKCYDMRYAPSCAKCKKKIGGEIMHALKMTWHVQCFTCAACRTPIRNRAFYMEEGQPYCERDYEKMFGTKCRGCDFKIDAGDRFLEALGFSWHDTCFVCAICQVSLEGKTFYSKKDKPLCKSHAFSHV
ncbi:PDZ and LIM domain protein 7 isoform X2 [Terrapene carolina triunguis]|uniref:PDZ and LIM domain protein 7 isoform X2 n=1 Tax=Terrapene triunguis TaxID=2587831 RepID=UPI000E773FF7|nr:PDZ and LIM domain protein 7 isoform X2 [Terrapene carolina triunguis]